MERFYKEMEFYLLELSKGMEEGKKKNRYESMLKDIKIELACLEIMED